MEAYKVRRSAIDDMRERGYEPVVVSETLVNKIEIN